MYVGILANPVQGDAEDEDQVEGIQQDETTRSVARNDAMNVVELPQEDLLR